MLQNFNSITFCKQLPFPWQQAYPTRVYMWFLVNIWGEILFVPETCWEFFPWCCWRGRGPSFQPPWRSQTGKGTLCTRCRAERSAGCGTAFHTDTVGTEEHCGAVKSWIQRSLLFVAAPPWGSCFWCSLRVKHANPTLLSPLWAVWGTRMGPSSSAGLNMAPLWPKVKMVFRLFRDGLEKKPSKRTQAVIGWLLPWSPAMIQRSDPPTNITEVLRIDCPLLVAQPDLQQINDWQ